MTTLRYIKEPQDGARRLEILVENWERGVSGNPKGGVTVSFVELAGSDKHALVLAWLRGLDANSGRRLWALHRTFAKRPLARDREAWGEAFAIWNDAQLAMEAVERGDGRYSKKAKEEAGLDITTMHKYFTQAEIDALQVDKKEAT